MITGLNDIIEHMDYDMEHKALSAHHGVFILGLFDMLKTLPDMVEGLEYMWKKEEKEEQE